jgi:hypothetical protein
MGVFTNANSAINHFPVQVKPCAPVKKRIVIKPGRNFNANSDHFYLTRFGAPKQSFGA